MEEQKELCPRCNQEPPNHVLYRCARCFKVYCDLCDDSNTGKNCPNCGMFARMVLGTDDGPKKAA